MSGTKKLVVFLLIALCAVSLNGFFPSSASAANFTIATLDDSASKNQDVIFEELNIGPGFKSTTYPITINNESSSPVKISLTSIEADSSDANTLLPAVKIFFSNAKGDMSTTDTYDKVIDMGFETDCLMPGSESDAFYTGFTFDKSYGNEYQNASFKVIYTFLVTTSDTDCPEIPPVDPSEPPNPPDTGGLSVIKNGDVVTSSLTIFTIVSFVSAFIFFVLILKRRKKSDKKKP